MRKIAVFDTNILFSGVGWKGKPFLCLELPAAGMVDGVTCRELLDELAEKLQSKLSFHSGADARFRSGSAHFSTRCSYHR